MDGNRTHPGRVIGAPQTVLKTAGRSSMTVRSRVPKFGSDDHQCATVRTHPPSFAGLAVFLAVIDPPCAPAWSTWVAKRAGSTEPRQQSQTTTHGGATQLGPSLSLLVEPGRGFQGGCKSSHCCAVATEHCQRGLAGSERLQENTCT